MEVHTELCSLSTAGERKRGEGEEAGEERGRERRKKWEEGGRGKRRGKTEAGEEVREGESEGERLDTLSSCHIPDKNQLEGRVCGLKG